MESCVLSVYFGPPPKYSPRFCTKTRGPPPVTYFLKMERKNSQFKLTQWKKIPPLDSRVSNKEEAKRSFSAILLQIRNIEVKELLNKLSVSAIYDENLKVLNEADVNILKECFKFVACEIQNCEEICDGLTKDGLIYNIVKGLFSMFPHYCGNC